MFFQRIFTIIVFISIVWTQFNWQDGGVPVQTYWGKEWFEAAVLSGEDLIIAWSDSQLGSPDVYAQKFDSDGNPYWDDGGIPIFIGEGTQRDVKMITDNNGGAYIFWAEPNYDGCAEIMVQHMNSDGGLLWELDGISLGLSYSESFALDTGYKVISDNNGGVFFYYYDCDSGNSIIYLNETGIYTTPEEFQFPFSNYIDIKIASDYNGALICVFRLMEGIYAMKFDHSGEPLWGTSDGVVTVFEGQGSISDDGVVTLDNSSIVIAYAVQYSGDNNYNLYLQIINQFGGIEIDEGGIPFLVDQYISSPIRLIADGNNVYSIWKEYSGDIKIQHISSDGWLLLQEDGLIIPGISHYSVLNAVSDLNGALYILVNYGNLDSVILQKYDPSVGFTFGEFGLDLLPSVSDISNGKLLSGSQESLWVMVNQPSDSQNNLFAQKIVNDAPFFEEEGITLYQSNSFRSADNLSSIQLDSDSYLLYWEDVLNTEIAGRIVNNGYVSDLISLTTHPSHHPTIIQVEDQYFMSYIKIDMWGNYQSAFIMFDNSLVPITDPEGFVISNSNNSNISMPISNSCTNNNRDVFVTYSVQDLVGSSGLNIFIQKINDLGLPEWVEGGIPLTDNDYTDEIVQHVSSNPNSGAVVFWSTNSFGSQNLFVTSIDENGDIIPEWGNEPVALDTSGNFRRAWFQDGTDGILVTWTQENELEWKILARFIRYNGELVPATNEIEVFNSNSSIRSSLGSVLLQQGNSLNADICGQIFNGIKYDLQCRKVNILNGEMSEIQIISNSSNGDYNDLDVELGSNQELMISWVESDSPMWDNHELKYQEFTEFPGPSVFRFGGVTVSNNFFDFDHIGILPNSSEDNSALIYWLDGRHSINLEYYSVYVQSRTVLDNSCSDVVGDINRDNILDVLDLIIILNMIINEESFEYCPFIISDANGDDIVDILDIVLLVSYIMEE